MTEWRSPDKPLNKMDRLADMGHFPVVVNAGATANVLLTLCVTWWLVGIEQQRLQADFAGATSTSEGPAGAAMTLHRLQFWSLAAPLLWVGVVLVVNLLPVVMLRLRTTPATAYPPLRGMNFVTDQHKFSDWVYLAASANMAFWVLAGWLAFSWSHTAGTLVVMLLVAAVATFSPVLLRGARG